MDTIEIREAVADDSQLILKFVKELALYEKAEHEVVAEEKDIRDSIFGADTTVQALICSLNNIPIGFAVYFYNYSTWQGRKGIYLEDLYISPEYRRAGAGKKLLKYLAGVAVTEGCGRFEWSVLDWNEPALQLYNSIGAKPKSGWISYQLAGEALLQFAKS